MAVLLRVTPVDVRADAVLLMSPNHVPPSPLEPGVLWWCPLWVRSETSACIQPFQHLVDLPRQIPIAPLLFTAPKVERTVH